MQGPVGDWVARDVAQSQPTKLAAIEGLPRTTRGAPEHLLGWYQNGRVKKATRGIVGSPGRVGVVDECG